jgi:hypothetical protein
MSWHHRSSGLKAGLNNMNAMQYLGFDTRITPFPAIITHLRSRNLDVHASSRCLFSRQLVLLHVHTLSHDTVFNYQQPTCSSAGPAQ